MEHVVKYYLYWIDNNNPLQKLSKHDFFGHMSNVWRTKEKKSSFALIFICGWYIQMALMAKNLPVNTGDMRERRVRSLSHQSPWRRKWLPTQESCLRTSGQRNLAVCIHEDYKQLDWKRISTHTCITHSNIYVSTKLNIPVVEIR